MKADLILRNGRFTTLDRANPTPTAAAIAGGVFAVVGGDKDAMALAGPATSVIDLKEGARQSWRDQPVEVRPRQCLASRLEASVA
jgi:hypothetical protein